MKKELYIEEKEKILKNYIEKNRYLSEYIDKERYLYSDDDKIHYKGKKAIYHSKYPEKELPCIVVSSKELIKGVKYLNIIVEKNEKNQFIFTPETNVRYIDD